MKRFCTVLTGATLALGLGGVDARANEFDADLKRIFAEMVQPWLADPALVEAVKAQNAEKGGLGATDIEALDQAWRAEADAGSGPLIDAVLSNPLSAMLKQKQEASDGLFLEIFVMDGKGLNVGQSAVTSDYMQGDEAKWQETFAKGPDAMLIDEIEFDDSAGAFVSQVSQTVVDPATGAPIGSVTVSINVDKL